jgi:hypothetical protein
MALSMEKTRLAPAELHVKARMICAAWAYAGNLLPLTLLQCSTPSVKAWLSLVSVWSIMAPLTATWWAGCSRCNAPFKSTSGLTTASASTRFARRT